MLWVMQDFGHQSIYYILYTIYIYIYVYMVRRLAFQAPPPPPSQWYGLVRGGGGGGWRVRRGVGAVGAAAGRNGQASQSTDVQLRQCIEYIV